MRPDFLTAAALMFACTMLIAGTTLFAKALGNGSLGMVVHPLTVSQARFVFGLAGVLGALGVLRAAGRPLWAPGPKPAWGRHALRTCLGWLSGFLMFSAAAQMPLAEVSALAFLSPMATMVFAVVLLGEKVGRWRWGAAALAMVGALVLLRPGAGVVQPAALLALGAAVAMGLEAIMIKNLVTHEPTGRTMLINNAMGVLIATLIAAPVWAWPENAAIWAALAAIGLVTVAAQFTLLSASQRADASFVAPFLYLTLVWAGAYDLAVFGVWPDAVGLGGAATIVSGGLLMTWREVRARDRGPRETLRAKR